MINTFTSSHINGHGATVQVNNRVTLTKTFTYVSGISGNQELRCTASDGVKAHLLHLISKSQEILLMGPVQLFQISPQ